MKAFVIMSFSSEFDDIYTMGIKICCKENGFTAIRLDEQIFDEGMLDRIYHEITTADIIIAELSNKNPNVFYELGFAHALNKKCILLTQEIDNIPFDLKHKRHIKYKNLIELVPKLKNELLFFKSLIEEDKKLPVAIETTLDGELEIINGARKDAVVDFSIDIFNKSNKPIQNINSIVIHLNTNWEIKYNNDRLIATDSNLENFKWRYYLKPPSSSIAKNGWMPIRLKMSKILAYKFENDFKIKTKRYTGEVNIEIITDHETYQIPIEVKFSIEEGLPF